MSEGIEHLESFVNEDLPEEEIVKLILQYQETQCPAVHEKIINGRMGFILKQCNTFSSKYTNLKYGEVLSSIFEGVNRAISGFKPDKGTKFSTYSMFWIRVYLANNNTKMTSILGINQVQYSKVKRLSGLIDKDDNITDTELSIKLDVSERKVRELKALKECMSNYSIHSDTFIEHQMEMQLNEEKKIDYDKDFIEICINDLDERKAFVVREKFGLNEEGEAKTLQQISDKVGITHQRVHQILKDALIDLKNIYVQKREQENG